MKSKKIPIDEIRKACEELAEMGLIQDSGRRRNGQVVWVITPRGKVWANGSEDSELDVAQNLKPSGQVHSRPPDQ